MTISQLLSHASRVLSQADIQDPAFEAGLLLSWLLKVSMGYLYAYGDTAVSTGQEESYMHLVTRRSLGEPMAYITGECEFMSLEFQVNPHVLIPRADTELLAEAALFAMGHKLPLFNQRMIRLDAPPKRVLDIGTGSGCLAVTLAAFMPGLMVDALDVSRDALQTAEENARHHGVSQRIRFIEADYLKSRDFTQEVYQIILSNPPYIAYSEKEGLMPSVRDYEPHLALFADDNGLVFYRKIASDARRLLDKGGIVLVECGYQQAEAVEDIFRETGMETLVLRDLSGIKRVVAGQFPHS